MKRFFEAIFNTESTADKQPLQEDNLQLITATLLIEISKADFSQDEEEIECIQKLLEDHFNLSPDIAQELTQKAQRHSDHITSLQQMTRELNESVSQLDKVKIIELMWKVVYADGENNRYEEHLIRQVADLLYVSHAQFIKARHKAEG